MNFKTTILDNILWETFLLLCIRENFISLDDIIDAEFRNKLIKYKLNKKAYSKKDLLRILMLYESIEYNDDRYELSFFFEQGLLTKDTYSMNDKIINKGSFFFI